MEHAFKTKAPVTRDTLSRALALHQSGDFKQAEALYRDLLSRESEQPDAWHLLGLLAHQQGQHETALAMIGHAIGLNPASAAYHANLAEAAWSLERFDLVVTSLEKAVELEPELAIPRANLANILYELDRYPEALARVEEVIGLDPTYPRAWNILGNIHEAMAHGDPSSAAAQRAQAKAAYGQAIALDPGFALAHSNLALSLEHEGSFAEAHEAYDRAIALDPELVNAHWNHAILLLTDGNFKRGWQEYEWRWRWPAFTSPRRGFTQPLWKGQALPGKKILMYAEQGFGDTIQFIRYAPLLAKLGAEVIVECPRELARLFQTIEGASQIVTAGDPLPAVDFQVPFMSLPLGFRTRLDTIPASVPYLAPDPALAASWGKRLEEQSIRKSGELTVGLVWAGRPTPKGFNANRSMALRDYSPLFRIPGVRFISLQKGAGAEQIRDSGLPLIDLTADIQDFADLAALMSNLDLVISVDTAAAHLAGALGRAVWNIVPRPGAFQWMRNRLDSPWYPTMQLFRQEEFWDWTGVVAKVEAALRERASSRSGS